MTNIVGSITCLAIVARHFLLREKRMELYRKLMNHGIIIYETEDSKFTVRKVPTANDRRNSTIYECESVPITFHDNYDDALTKAKQLIGWVEETPVHVQDASTSWKMEMSYRHKGLGQKYADLGEFPSSSYDAAVTEAKKRAEAYIVHGDMEKSVDGFEVRVRPCRKRS